MGMRQRLGVARCLLADPELLILDEPMNGLDPAGILEFRELIRALVDEGRTVVLSSHLLDEVEKTCDQVAIVDRGESSPRAARRARGDGQTRVLIGVDGADEALRARSRGGRGVADVGSRDGAAPTSRSTDARPLCPELNRRLVEAGIACTGSSRCRRRSRSGSSRSPRGWRTRRDAPPPRRAPRLRPFGLAARRAAQAAQAARPLRPVTLLTSCRR